MFLSTTDFVGKFELHTGMYDQGKLQSYIDRYEKKYLVQLFGVNLYNDFVADLGGSIPNSPNFVKVFYPFIEQLDMRTMVISEGILDMLKGFIYFEYAKDLFNQMTPFGNVAQNSENSTVVTSLNSMMYTRYNESVKTYRAIQAYMLFNSTAPIGQVVNFAFTSYGIGYQTELIETYLTGGSGNGFAFDAQMTLVNGIFNAGTTLTQGGSGYTNGGLYSVSGGSGNGCNLTVETGVGGAVIGLTIVNSGIDFTVGNVLTIDGGDGQAQFEVTETGVGSIRSTDHRIDGINYQLGDVLTVEGAVVENATLEVVYVGIGDYGKFAGINLQYAYWI